MVSIFRDLRYVCVHVDDLGAACSFATEVFGLQLADHNHEQACFRSDARNYALRYSNHDTTQTIALSVASAGELTQMEEQLIDAGYAPTRLLEKRPNSAR
jgi:2,3-dihydroxy-p-cumate/2,3-dihydroxybenzoate 3,4-dioxygenase